jgi:hypothetical protein
MSSAGNGFDLSFFPIKCALGWSYYGQYTGWILLIPICLLFSWVSLSVYHICLHRRSFDANLMKQMAAEWARCSIVILFMLYSTVTKHVLEVFDVYEKPINDHTFLMADLSVRADDEKYVVASIFGGLGTIVYVIGIPLLGFCVLYRHRNELGTESNLAAYGFLYDGFKLDTAYLWELVVIARKCLIGSVVVFFHDSFMQSFSGCVILIVFLCCHIEWRPYSSDILNNSEAASLFTSVVTQLCSLMFWYTRDDPKIVTGTTVVLILAHAWCVAYFLYSYIQVKRSEAADRTEDTKMEVEMQSGFDAKNMDALQVNQPVHLSQMQRNPMSDP